ncbi:MAG: tRNA (N6-threonylcarbamoyladenosine(37)-N6)-methyltransferase TrmO [bacterium]|nr:tRNA (N6-threonylcarbamoyladenosine(37)-N6)-methyltransferase TrmO [bacterium]
MDTINYTPIGIIHTAFADKKQTPIQGVFSEKARGTVEVFPQFADGLKDIEAFTHLYLLYHFHRSEGFKLRRQPFLEDTERGIFAIRHFSRPNPIGMSVVTLEKVSGNVLEISDIDVLDGTPLLDIKPYVHRFDHRQGSDGWVANPEIDFNRGKAGNHR